MLAGGYADAEEEGRYAWEFRKAEALRQQHAGTIAERLDSTRLRLAIDCCRGFPQALY